MNMNVAAALGHPDPTAILVADSPLRIVRHRCHYVELVTSRGEPLGCVSDERWYACELRRVIWGPD
jgi:hypothetical protein